MTIHICAGIEHSHRRNTQAKMEKTFRVATSSGKHWGIQAAGAPIDYCNGGTRNHVDPYHYFSTYFARESLSSNI
jgi:hypothetical protein